MSKDAGDDLKDAPSFSPGDFDARYEPGTDFYRHVNAKWLEENPIPPEYGSWGVFHEVHVRNEALLRQLLDDAAAAEADAGSPEQMAGDYWAVGLDEAAIEEAGLTPIEPFLDIIDGVSDGAQAIVAAARMRARGVGAIFGSYVSPDFEDSTQYLLYVMQGGLGLPERDYYFRDDDHSVELLDAYVAHIERMLEMVGRDDDPAGAAAAILELEKRIAGHSFTATELRDTELTTNKVPRSEFSGFPGLDLAAYLETAAGVIPDTINIDNPDYFKKIGRTLTETSPETLRSYLRWTLIRATASSLTRAFVQASFDFYGKRLGGQRELRPRWKRVLSAASSDIGQQVSKLYVAAAFSPSAKERCETMVERLIDAMGHAIDELDWMGEATKAKAREKLAGFSFKIGYPEVWRDYSNLSIDRSSYAGNRLRASSFEYQRKIAKLGTPVDSDDWAMEPHAVNAYYHPLYNEIVFPAGILQPPFFWADGDDASNLGAIGTVIGHEITHGFDDQGSKFDAAGNLSNWWTEEDRAAFDAKAAGLAEQYSRYEPIEGVTVNGELTLGENIADLGGVKIAYNALLASLAEQGVSPDDIGPDGLTVRQRFFGSYATIWRGNYTDEYTRLIVSSDPHSPHEYRCNGVLENFPPFAAAFGLDAAAPLAKPVDAIVAIW